MSWVHRHTYNALNLLFPGFCLKGISVKMRIDMIDYSSWSCLLNLIVSFEFLKKHAFLNFGRVC